MKRSILALITLVSSLHATAATEFLREDWICQRRAQVGAKFANRLSVTLSARVENKGTKFEKVTPKVEHISIVSDLDVSAPIPNDIHNFGMKLRLIRAEKAAAVMDTDAIGNGDQSQGVELFECKLTAKK